MGWEDRGVRKMDRLNENEQAKICRYVLPTVFDKPFLEMGNIAYPVSAQYILNLLYL